MEIKGRKRRHLGEDFGVKGYCVLLCNLLPVSVVVIFYKSCVRGLHRGREALPFSMYSA